MVDGRLLGLLVAAGALVTIGVARSRIHRIADRGTLEPEQIQLIRRRLLALLFVCGVAVAAAMTAAVVAAGRAGDNTVSALAWGGLLAGVIVAAGAALNAASLWRNGRW